MPPKPPYHYGPLLRAALALKYFFWYDYDRGWYLCLVSRFEPVLTCSSRDIHVNTQKNQKILSSLVPLYMSTEDIEEPLTPSHLLIGRRVLSLPNAAAQTEEFDTSPTHLLNKRMRHLQRCLDHFWKRWRSEYLLELRNSHHYYAGKVGHNPDAIKVGDIVLVHSVVKPRGTVEVRESAITQAWSK